MAFDKIQHPSMIKKKKHYKILGIKDNFCNLMKTLQLTLYLTMKDNAFLPKVPEQEKNGYSSHFY